MAFSTQKEFFHVPFMNETVDYECRKACVKLKSYDSTIDDRSWAMDETLQSRFLSDLVTCQTPVGFMYEDGDGDVDEFGATDDSGYGGGAGGSGGSGGGGGGAGGAGGGVGGRDGGGPGRGAGARDDSGGGRSGVGGGGRGRGNMAGGNRGRGRGNGLPSKKGGGFGGGGSDAPSGAEDTVGSAASFGGMAAGSGAGMYAGSGAPLGAGKGGDSGAPFGGGSGAPFGGGSGAPLGAGKGADSRGGSGAPLGAGKRAGSGDPLVTGQGAGSGAPMGAGKGAASGASLGAGKGGASGASSVGGKNANYGSGKNADGRAGSEGGGLVNADSVLTCANQSLGKLQGMLLRKEDLQKQLEVSNERLKVANLENEKIKAIMNEKFDSNHSKDFYNKIQKLASSGKISKGEENELLQIYNKFEDMGKAYEVLQAENAYLKRLMEKLSLRASFETVKLDEETSNDLSYLQKQVNSLRKEVTILRSIEDQKLNRQFDSERSNMSDQDAENIKAIIKERNALREKCKTFKDLEKRVYDLQKKAKEADHMSGSLSSNLDSQTKYIGEMEHEMQRMQDYYEDQLTKMKFNEELLKCQLDEMKEDLIRAKCGAQKVDCLQMEIGCLRNELMRRDVALSDYDCQYKQLMTVIGELQGNSIQNLHDTQTQTCTDYIDDLAFFARATLNEIKKEVSKRGADGDKIGGSYNRTITAGAEECGAEMERLRKAVERLTEERAQLEHNMKEQAEEMCADALRRLKEMEDDFKKAKMDVTNVKEEKDQMSVKTVEKLNEFSERLYKMDVDMDRTSKEAADMNKGLNDSIKLVKDISDVQLKNQQLANAVNAINSRDDEKIIDDLRRQLLEEQKKNKKCLQENENLRKVLVQRGIDPEAAAQGVSKEMGGQKVKSEADKSDSARTGVGGSTKTGDASSSKTGGLAKAGDGSPGKTGADGPGKTGAGGAAKAGDGDPTKGGDSDPAKAGGAGSAKSADGGSAKSGDVGPGKSGDIGSTKSGDVGARKAGDADPTKAGGVGSGKAGDADPAKSGLADSAKSGVAGSAKSGVRDADKSGDAEKGGGSGAGGTDTGLAGDDGSTKPGDTDKSKTTLTDAGSVKPGVSGTTALGGTSAADITGDPQHGTDGSPGKLTDAQFSKNADIGAMKDGLGSAGVGDGAGSPGDTRGKYGGTVKDGSSPEGTRTGKSPQSGKGGKGPSGSRKGGAKGADGQGEGDPFQQFIDLNATTMMKNITAGAALEKELRGILNAFMQECGFCFCKSVIPKSKFYALCHKLLHNGIQCMSFRELAYLHRKVFMAAEKLHPGCLLNMILTEQGLKDGDGLKCCYCKNALCCSNSEEMLKEKVCKLERDIEMAKEYLDSLKTQSASPKTPYTRGKTFRPLVEELPESVDDLLTYRETKIPTRCSTKQIKSLKARILKCSELLR